MNTEFFYYENNFENYKTLYPGLLKYSVNFTVFLPCHHSYSSARRYIKIKLTYEIVKWARLYVRNYLRRKVIYWNLLSIVLSNVQWTVSTLEYFVIDLWLLYVFLIGPICLPTLLLSLPNRTSPVSYFYLLRIIKLSNN